MSALPSCIFSVYIYTFTVQTAIKIVIKITMFTGKDTTIYCFLYGVTWTGYYIFTANTADSTLSVINSDIF